MNSKLAFITQAYFLQPIYNPGCLIHTHLLKKQGL